MGKDETDKKIMVSPMSELAKKVGSSLSSMEFNQGAAVKIDFAEGVTVSHIEVKVRVADMSVDEIQQFFNGIAKAIAATQSTILAELDAEKGEKP